MRKDIQRLSLVDQVLHVVRVFIILEQNMPGRYASDGGIVLAF